MEGFKYELGQVVDSFDGRMTELLVIGQVTYIGGGLGYVVTGASHAHGSIVRHTVSEYEIKPSRRGEQKKDK